MVKNGVDVKMSAFGEKPAKAARQVLGSRWGAEDDCSWVGLQLFNGLFERDA